jgi:hypothetical protein
VPPGPRPPATRPLNAGDRPDNEWLQYDRSRWPDTKEKHDALPYVHKAKFGWYCWPPVTQVHAPCGEQPTLEKQPEEMSDVERAIFDYFTDGQNVERLLATFCLEEEEGEDKFSNERYSLIKVSQSTSSR